MLPKTRIYVKSCYGETEWMSYLIKMANYWKNNKVNINGFCY